MNKIAFFVIVKNSNDKLLSKGNKDEYHYDANCFIGQLKKDSTWSIIWLDAISLTNYPILDKASSRIREAHFTLFNRRKDKDGNSFYKYNFNDKRFWDGPVWSIYYK